MSAAPVTAIANGTGSIDGETIVSVNAGPSIQTPWKRYLFFGTLFLVTLALGALALSSFRLGDFVGQSKSPKQLGTPIDPNAALDRNLPVVSAPVNTPTVSVAGLGEGAACPNRVVLDPQGLPAIGADGQPIEVTCDGRSVPKARGTPTISVAGLSATTQTAPLVSDRYGGGIIIEPPKAKPGGVGDAAPAMNDDARQAMALLQRLDPQTFGQGTAPRPAAAPPAAPGTLGGQSTSPGPIFAPSGSGGATGTTRGVGLSADARAGETERLSARVMPGRRMLALRGTQVDCNLTLAYVSDQAGDAHCIVARDVFGHDGATVLVDRGSLVNGVFRSSGGLGDRRAVVMWDRIVTPHGVTIALASPGTDALGATGIPAEVDQRWLDRIGMATAISVIKDLTTAVVARRAASGTASAVASSAQNFADEVLTQTLGIRPSLYVKQGDTASILLRQDLDFSGVYALRR